MNEDLYIDEKLTIPGYELWFTASRSGGPGGQHVNTKSSRVTLHWVPSKSGALAPDDKARLIARLSGRLTANGEVQVNASDERSQHRNKQLALARLAELVRQARVRRKRRVRTKTPKWAKRKRLENKRQRSQTKSGRKKVDPSDY